MGKKLFLTLILFSFIFSACGKTDENSNNDTEKNGVTLEDRTLNLEDIGLSYVIPESWVNNTFLKTYKTDEILAELVYTFVSDENMSKLAIDTETDKTLHKNVCEIIVFKTEYERLNPIKELFDKYENVKEIAVQGDYSYYLLSGYKDLDLSNVSEEGKKRYNRIVDDIYLLEESIETKPFDENAVLNNQNEIDKTITFSSETLDGTKITSLCFADYDVTLLNFGATYATDETETLNELTESLKDYENVQILSAYIDLSPQTDNTEAKKLRENSPFQTIVMDEKLGNWVLRRLQGVPTSILIDTNGKIIGEFIEGAKTADFYKQSILDALDEIENNK